MNYPFLERLYWIAAGESRYYEEGKNLSELYRQLPEADRAYSAMADGIRAAITDEEAVSRLQEALDDAIWRYEIQGFINGFRLALALAKEW